MAAWVGWGGRQCDFPDPVLQVWSLELPEATIGTQGRNPAGEGVRGGTRSICSCETDCKGVLLCSSF